MKLRPRHVIAGGVAFGSALLLVSRARLADIRGQVVLITGGSRGLGFALAREFGKFGCHVAICARSQDQLASAEAILSEEGIDIFAWRCDVSDERQAKELVAKVQERFGRIDILVNNAGTILVAPLENTTAADLGQAMNTMFWGVVHPSLAVLPEMRARRNGRIATIASIGEKSASLICFPIAARKRQRLHFVKVSARNWVLPEFGSPPSPPD